MQVMALRKLGLGKDALLASVFGSKRFFSEIIFELDFFLVRSLAINSSAR
jgi:hypothetical protein